MKGNETSINPFVFSQEKKKKKSGISTSHLLPMHMHIMLSLLSSFHIRQTFKATKFVVFYYYCRDIIVRLGEQWEREEATTHCGLEIQLLDFLWEMYSTQPCIRQERKCWQERELLSSTGC